MQARDAVRFIPAGAGNMMIKATKIRNRTVHPRGCGEHPTRLERLSAQDGSSPRVRGTCSGRRWSCRPGSVHPRGCGEHRGHGPCQPNRCGSSPRVRGTFVHAAVAADQLRFIPAGAGNICCISSLLCVGAVHPRGCGEHKPKMTRTLDRHGSSPRVRGTLGVTYVDFSDYRFIPAGAGNMPSMCHP